MLAGVKGGGAATVKHLYAGYIRVGSWTHIKRIDSQAS